MKKNYEAPVAEKIEFRYADQVVASNVKCGNIVSHIDNDGNKTCDTGVVDGEYVN